MIKNPKRYATVKEISKAYPFTTAMIYYYCSQDPVFREKCVKKMGRRVLIDVDAFEKFIENEGK